jgi:hypothetical protein
LSARFGPSGLASQHATFGSARRLVSFSLHQEKLKC